VRSLGKEADLPNHAMTVASFRSISGWPGDQFNIRKLTLVHSCHAAQGCQRVRAQRLQTSGSTVRLHDIAVARACTWSTTIYECTAES